MVWEANKSFSYNYPMALMHTEKVILVALFPESVGPGPTLQQNLIKKKICSGGDHCIEN